MAEMQMRENFSHDLGVGYHADDAHASAAARAPEWIDAVHTSDESCPGAPARFDEGTGTCRVRGGGRLRRLAACGRRRGAVGANPNFPAPRHLEEHEGQEPEWIAHEGLGV
jgi:hypothetical protein